MTTTHVLITFHARPETAAPFRALLDTVRRDLPGVPGCHAVSVFSHHDDPCAFTLLEAWASVAAHQAHLAQVVASGAWDGLAAHLAREPASRYLQALAD